MNNISLRWLYRLTYGALLLACIASINMGVGVYISSGWTQSNEELELIKYKLDNEIELSSIEKKHINEFGFVVLLVTINNIVLPVYMFLAIFVIILIVMREELPPLSDTFHLGFIWMLSIAIPYTLMNLMN